MPKRTKPTKAAAITSLDFLSRLNWIDGKPLSIEPYRQVVFREAFDTFDENGRPRYSMVLCGRGKKNWKSADLILAALYSLMMREAAQGSDVLILANDEAQAGDDLGLAKKLVAVNPDLNDEIEVRAKELVRRDGKGSIKILPARDVIGAHGKSACLICYDELHAYRDYDLIEALSPDPTRDCLVWICSYQTIYSQVGIPLFDLFQAGKNGTDPKMLFSWYSGSYCTDPNFGPNLEPELRANPSIASWKDGRAYLDAQRKRLPFAKFRRLHLNEPGSPTGAFLDQGKVLECVSVGIKRRPPQSGFKYQAYVDMSGGSNDNAVLAIAHQDHDGSIVLDCIVRQAGGTPFNPRKAVEKFCDIMNEYGCTTVHGDAYAGQTFRLDFEAHDKRYQVIKQTASDILELLEPKINAREVKLLDDPTLIEELCTLIITRGGKVQAESNSHDDHAVAAAGAILVAVGRTGRVHYSMMGINFDTGESTPIRTFG
jgi:hypothetical protein